MNKDEIYMTICLDLAKVALERGDFPVGCILVLDDKVIGTGIESGKTTQDVTNHAEILAVRDAIHQGYAPMLHQATLYTTHEPCIMCAYVLRHHRIPRIVYGTAVHFIGGHSSTFNILTTEDIPKWGTRPEIVANTCQAACSDLNMLFEQRKA